MGEYLTERVGDQIVQRMKAGTMDDWRYVRMSEMEVWAPIDARDNTNVFDALSDTDILWRFPWPDEDGDVSGLSFNWSTMQKREMGRSIWFQWNTRNGIDHHERWLPMHPEGLEYSHNVNIAIPCPMIPGFPLKTSRGGFTPLASIYGERRNAKGETRTVFTCAWCGAAFSIGADELEQVQQAILHSGKDNEWFHQVAARIKPRLS
jgi:hypothetical protein